VLRSRRRVQVGRIALQAASNGKLGARLGISVAKRLVRKAVERNRFKRLVREAFRTNGIKLQTLDLFVSLRTGLGSTRRAPERAVIRNEIAALLEQAARMLKK
jgi:ribonuclease P protein component